MHLGPDLPKGLRDQQQMYMSLDNDIGKNFILI